MRSVKIPITVDYKLSPQFELVAFVIEVWIKPNLYSCDKNAICVEVGIKPIICFPGQQHNQQGFTDFHCCLSWTSSDCKMEQRGGKRGFNDDFKDHRFSLGSHCYFAHFTYTAQLTLLRCCLGKKWTSQLRQRCTDQLSCISLFGRVTMNFFEESLYCWLSNSCDRMVDSRTVILVL